MTALQPTNVPGIDPQSKLPTSYAGRRPYNEESFKRLGVDIAWTRYDHYLSWGRDQCLAILDDG
jgi:hypothetical protein